MFFQNDYSRKKSIDLQYTFVGSAKTTNSNFLGNWMWMCITKHDYGRCPCTSRCGEQIHMAGDVPQSFGPTPQGGQKDVGRFSLAPHIAGACGNSVARSWGLVMGE